MSKLGSASFSLATLQICIPATQSTSGRSNRKRDMYRPRKQASGHLVKEFWSPGKQENNLERRREDVVSNPRLFVPWRSREDGQFRAC